MADAIVEKTVEGKTQKYKIVEVRIDGNNTVKRTLVPISTTEDDIPIGSTLLDEDETRGILSKQGKPEKIMVGDGVRLREQNSRVGSVVSKLRSGKVEVLWEDTNLKERHEIKELAKIY